MDPSDRRRDRQQAGRNSSERWPKTPRVIRWLWVGSVTALLASQTFSDQGMDTEDMLRLLIEVTEIMRENSQYEMSRPVPSPGCPADGAGATAADR